MINKKGVIKLDTKIWDVREYNEDLQQYPKINELKDIVLNGGLIGLPTGNSLWTCSKCDR